MDGKNRKVGIGLFDAGEVAGFFRLAGVLVRDGAVALLKVSVETPRAPDSRSLHARERVQVDDDLFKHLLAQLLQQLAELAAGDAHPEWTLSEY